MNAFVKKLSGSDRCPTGHSKLDLRRHPSRARREAFLGPVGITFDSAPLEKGKD